MYVEFGKQIRIGKIIDEYKINPNIIYGRRVTPRKEFVEKIKKSVKENMEYEEEGTPARSNKIEKEDVDFRIIL
jgi:hypothetical protein